MTDPVQRRTPTPPPRTTAMRGRRLSGARIEEALVRLANPKGSTVAELARFLGRGGDGGGASPRQVARAARLALARHRGLAASPHSGRLRLAAAAASPSAAPPREGSSPRRRRFHNVRIYKRKKRKSMPIRKRRRRGNKSKKGRKCRRCRLEGRKNKGHGRGPGRRKRKPRRAKRKARRRRGKRRGGRGKGKRRCCPCSK